MPPRKQKQRTRRAFGQLRQLPSKRWQAGYTGPDLATHRAPVTFLAKLDAEAWLLDEYRLIQSDSWTPPAARKAAAEEARRQAEDAGRLESERLAAEEAARVRFGAFAAKVVAERKLSDRTRDQYNYLLRIHILPTFEFAALEDITPGDVRTWHANIKPVPLKENRRIRKDKPEPTVPKAIPTAAGRAYDLLRMIMNVALEDELIIANPCRIKGAATVKPAHKARVLSPAEVDRLATAVPPYLAAWVLIASFCGLRKGELFELRRKDVSADGKVITVSRQVQRRNGQTIVGPPKAGSEGEVIVPSNIRDRVVQHLAEHVGPFPDSLLFADPATGDHMPAWRIQKVWTKARTDAGLEGLWIHETRHTAGTLAAQAGGTLAEIKQRLRHSTTAAAIRYQHAADGRAELLADRIAELSKGEK